MIVVVLYDVWWYCRRCGGVHNDNDCGGSGMDRGVGDVRGGSGGRSDVVVELWRWWWMKLQYSSGVVEVVMLVIVVVLE